MLRKLIEKYKNLTKPLKATIWFLFCGIIQKGIGVVVTPIFTRIMTTEEYGVYTLFNSWLEIISVIITLRLSYGVFMQGLIRYDHDKDEYTSALQGITTLLVLAGVAAYVPFKDTWNAFTGLNTFLMSCIFLSAWATAMFGFWSVRQRIAYNYRLLVAVTLAVALIAPVSGILAVVSVETFKVEARVACIVGTDLLFYTGMFFYYMFKGRRFFVKEFWIHALKFNIPLIPHYLSYSVLNQSDRVMINTLVGAAAAGVYGLSNSIANLMSIVNQAIMNAMNPWIYQKIREDDTDSIASVSYVAIALVGLANLILIAFAPEAIWLFAPEQYQEGIWIIPPLAGGTFLMFMYNLFADFEFYYERTGLVTFASVAGALVNIGLNVLCIPVFGYLAAGYTTLLSNGVYIGMHYFFMRRVQKEFMNGERVYSIKAILGLCSCFALIAFVLATSYSMPIVRILIVIVLCSISIWRRHDLLSIWNDIRSAKES